MKHLVQNPYIKVKVPIYAAIFRGERFLRMAPKVWLIIQLMVRETKFFKEIMLILLVTTMKEHGGNLSV